MPTEIRRTDVSRMMEEGAQLVEVLPPKQYNKEHLPGALNLPLTRLTRETVAELDRQRPVIVYCNDYQ